MCDTVVALRPSTFDGSVLFAKNSDRYPNEAQYIEIAPRTKHPPGSTVQCTYRTLPQVETTYEAFLSRPFWMWGAEMGVNEYGVAIGNEAIFSRVKPRKEPNLLGMDLLRLGLERAASAKEALEIITGLLEQFGQGGNCSYRHKLYYHNSFIIADPAEAWLLETVERLWAAKRVEEFGSISNKLCIGAEWDEASDGLIEKAGKLTGKKVKGDFHFSGFLSDTMITRAACSRERSQRSASILHENNGSIDVKTMIRILSDHGETAATKKLNENRLYNNALCAHAGWGPARKDTQTTGSIIVHLKKDEHTIWITGTSAPCTSLFKPVWLKTGMPDIGPVPASIYDPHSLWWNHERLHRLTIENYTENITHYFDDRNRIQEEFISNANGTDPSCRRSFTEECFLKHNECIDRWIGNVKASPRRKKRFSLYDVAWNKFNKEAKFTI